MPEIVAKLANARVKRLDRTMRTRLHHAAFHHRQDEQRELSAVKASREAVAGVFEKPLHRARPAGEVLGDGGVYVDPCRVDLERQPPNRAAVSTAGHEYPLAIAVEQSENALDGVGGLGSQRLDQNGLEVSLVPVQHGAQQVFLALEEVIKAAAVGPA